MERIIYLDNSATTKPCKLSKDYFNNAVENLWGNPSSLHRIGIDAELAVNSARETVASFIKADPSEIIFTGSGTEANNTAILSALSKKWGNRVVTTEIEHPSVLETVKRLEASGFEVIRLKSGKDGKISVDDLKNSVNNKTVLVSIMLVNNETGSIQPIEECVKAVKSVSPRILFHCDAVQAFGKLPINVNKLGIDLLSASGHKIHAPKGIGFLYKKKSVTISPFITGGGQEMGFRSGTEPVPLIASFEGAIRELPNIATQLKTTEELWNYTADMFRSSGFIKVNSTDDCLPYIMNISVPGYRSETLLHFLEQKNIFVSSGSACAKGEASYVLSALGLNRNEADSALRISFSRDNSKEDIDALYSALKEATEKLRRTDL